MPLYMFRAIKLNSSLRGGVKSSVRASSWYRFCPLQGGLMRTWPRLVHIVWKKAASIALAASFSSSDLFVCLFVFHACIPHMPYTSLFSIPLSHLQSGTFTTATRKPPKTAVLNLWVATPAGVALGFPRGRLEPPWIFEKSNTEHYFREIN